MNDSVADLLAEAAIKRKITIYGRAMDRMDKALLRSIFHAGASVDYGQRGVETVEQLIDLCWVFHVTQDVVLHRMANIIVEIAGDRAASETYGIGMLVKRLEGDRVRETFSHARYLDRWEMRDGDWKIVHRHAVMDHGGVREFVIEPMKSGGRPDHSDPSYALFAALHDN